MPNSGFVVGTPHYVLMDGNRRIGPKVMQSPSGDKYAAIYGFSGKDRYQKYCVTSNLALTPYPLVQAYLRGLDGSPGDGLKLVVLDAASPREHGLDAATMEAVLEAQENQATHVTAAYRLMLDPEADAYRLEERHSDVQIQSGVVP